MLRVLSSPHMESLSNASLFKKHTLSLSHPHHPSSEHLSSKEGKTQTPVCVIIASGALLHTDRWLHAQFLVPLVPGEAKGLMLLIWGPHFDDCLPKAPVVLHLDDCNSLLVGPCAHPHPPVVHL